jgi:YggT family protein
MLVIVIFLRLILQLYLAVLICRFVLDWIQVLAREWRPHGPILLFAEAIYTLTDPPLRFLRRLIPPLSLGGIRLDLAFMVLMLGIYVALGVLPAGGRS